MERHKYGAAREQSSSSCSQAEPDNRNYRTLHATDLRRARRAREGDCALPGAAGRGAAGRRSCTCRSRTRSRPSGRRDEAIAAYRAAAAARPDFGDAYWSLANLKTYRFTDAEIAQHARRGGGRCDGSWSIAITCASRSARRSRIAAHMRNPGSYYERGNALKRAESRYRPEIIETNTRRQIEVCTREFFARTRGLRRSPARDPIFIVGLPRAGSTLIEQILASHSSGRRHAGAGRHPAHRAGTAGPRCRTSTIRATRPCSADCSRGLSRAGREVPGRHPRLSATGKAVLHRQDAEQLPAHRPDPPDAAEREDHRRAARADGLLLQQPQAAVRQRPGVHLQRRGHRALLPHLPRI